MARPTRAYAPHRPSWQRFHAHAAPLASSSGAGAAASASASGEHHPYARQYSHVYSARLAALRQRCVDNARRSLEEDGIEEEGGDNVAERIIEVKEGVWSILVGTIVKETNPKRRPGVAPSGAADAQSFLFPQESLRSHLFDSAKGDVLHLEDESGRVELAPEEVADASAGCRRSRALDPDGVATGVVAAVVGRVCAANGVMRVRSVHFAGCPPSPEGASGGVRLRGPALDKDGVADGDEPVLLLVSGLSCGSEAPGDSGLGASLALRREMLLEYLTDPANFSRGGASVCRVIVAGGGVAAPVQAAECDFTDKENNSNGSKSYESIARSKTSKRASSSASAASRLADSLRELDLYLAELLGSGVPVDYVPGRHDPTNANWPQRPMHSCLFPLSCGYVDLFGMGTNPYEAALDNADGEGGGGARVLGSDGLNVADLRRFLAKGAPREENEGGEEEEQEDGGRVRAVSCLDALNRTLDYGHMASTGPDSLPTFPFSESDPFVLKHMPSVYFAGNCDEFDTRLVDANGDEVAQDDGGAKKGGNGDATRLVCVPSFALTGEVVLVKLRSLKCEVVSFNDATL